MDEHNTIHVPGWVRVQDDRISAVGSGQAPAQYANGPESPAHPDRVIDAAQMAVVPGLVNGHTHLSQTLMRGLADDKLLLDWLKQVMWPIQSAMTPDDVQMASLLGLVEKAQM